MSDLIFLFSRNNNNNNNNNNSYNDNDKENDSNNAEVRCHEHLTSFPGSVGTDRREFWERGW